MKINVLFCSQFAEELYFTGKTTVVIDVLRASTVMVTALDNGAREVIPVSTLDFAMKISGSAFSSQTLLGGERNTKMIEGFQLGNSPAEYKPELVSGKSIILYTTNGSKAVVKAKFSENLFVACFNNLNAVVDRLLKINKDFEIICAGSNGFFNLEDSVCAGKIVSSVKKHRKNAVLTDAAEACLSLNEKYGKDIINLLQNTEHGKLLIENGFGSDLEICARQNNIATIPYYSSGSLKKLDVAQQKNEN